MVQMGVTNFAHQAKEYKGSNRRVCISQDADAHLNRKSLNGKPWRLFDVSEVRLVLYKKPDDQ